VTAQRIANELGIVVIGRNEGERLIGCLASARAHAQDIVYVDSGSTDGSVTVAERLGVSVVRLDLAQPFTAARARNAGAAALKALQPNVRFVQFVDGDCTLVDGWLDAAIAFMEQHKDVAVVCGRRRERRPETSVYNRLCDLEWDTPIGEAEACGGDAVVRLEAFEMAGGFRPQLIAGEEPELCVRLREKGWRIWRLDADMTRHDAAMIRFSQWWLRAVRSGYGYAQVFQLHRNSQFPIYRKETARAVLWGGLLPLVIALGTLAYPGGLTLALIYPLQVCRIAFARGPAASQAWLYALFVMLAKFAEFQGTARFYWRRRRGHAGNPIEYKRQTTGG
jgi:glycosyltransferase involved in cell wall biosynthesis